MRHEQCLGSHHRSRLRRWVSFHGFSLNVDPELEHFSGIVPCGISGYGVTSLVDLGLLVMMSDVDILIRQNFERVFGPAANEAPVKVVESLMA